jgi:predicted ATP-grasp superfamily ATP-dependent carboligase
MPKVTAKKPHVACVLGLEENGYGIVRSLAREGTPIIGIHSEAKSFGRFSRYCANYYLDPAIRAEEEICKILIESCGHVEEKPVLFPTSDKYALLLAKQKERLAAHFLYHWVCADYLSKIIDKAEMSLTCEKAGILTPTTYIPHVDEDLAGRAKEFPFPCIVKPVRNFDTRFPRGMKNFVAHSPTDLLNFYNRNAGLKDQTIWQEVIEGGDENIFQCTALTRESGEIGMTFCARKIHQYVPGFGSMCFGRSEWNEAVVSSALKLLASVGHRGFASLEFKYQAKNDSFYFIEMNPRLPWYSGLFADAGVNLPYLGYLDLTERANFPTVKQRDDIYWISFKRDLRWLLRTRKNRPVSLMSWLRSVSKARSYSWWEWKDPKPFLAASAQRLRNGIRKTAKQLGKSLKVEAPTSARPR